MCTTLYSYLHVLIPYSLHLSLEDLASVFVLQLHSLTAAYIRNQVKPQIYQLVSTLGNYYANGMKLCRGLMFKG